MLKIPNSQFPIPLLPLVQQLETPPDVATALAAFSSLPGCLLLESARQTTTTSGKHLGRYSFLMADPFAWVQCRDVDDATNCLQQLDQLLQNFSSQTVPNLPPFQGGLAGYFAYDLNRAFENIPPADHDEFETPLLAFGCYDVVLAWDHLENQSWLISHGFPETDSQLQKQKAKQRIDFFKKQINQPAKPPHPPTSLDPAELAQQYPIGPDGLTSNFTHQQYIDAVTQCVDYIYNGDIFQVNFAQRLLAKATCSDIELYQRLRRCNPAPFAGYFDFGSLGSEPGAIISASPERFVSVRNRTIETRPIKGTRVRTGRPMVDIPTQQNLESSQKDLAENTMIVDLMRNDLSRICTDDSVNVTQLCEIENYQSVMHLVSAVEGKLVDTIDTRGLVSELLKASFPGGSITGAPKVRAMQIIAELEPTARGPYCGSMGYFGFDRSVDLSILIRTITSRRGWWQIPVGGGIVSQSSPTKEFEETMTKAAGMLSAVFGV